MQQEIIEIEIENEQDIEIENEQDIEIIIIDSDNEEEEEVIEPAYDSDYNSECEDVCRNSKVQHLDTAEIITIDDDDTTFCIIFLFFISWDSIKLCTQLFEKPR